MTANQLRFAQAVHHELGRAMASVVAAVYGGRDSNGEPLKHLDAELGGLPQRLIRLGEFSQQFLDAFPDGK